MNLLFYRPGQTRLTAVVAIVLANACMPSLTWARIPQFDSAALLTPEPTSFAECPQFFVNGTPPAVAPQPKLRELCYEAFAVLHSGTAKTPRATAVDTWLQRAT